MIRDTLADLLDQKTPFGRLALVHVVMTAGDTLVTVSLAGSLFFSISPAAAKDRVILYLLLTMAPFAVVAPLLGPVIDQSRGARRATVVVSALSRAAVCLVMADGLKSLLLFPEAFTMLVLSKVYLVTKGSLVPLFVDAADGGVAQDDGSGVDRPPSPPGARGPDPAGPDLGGPDLGGPDLGGPDPGDAGAERPDHNALATANARLGLLASLTAFAASLPAIAVLKLLGGPWVLRLDMAVFLAGTVLALRLPMKRVVGAAKGTAAPRAVRHRADRRVERGAEKPAPAATTWSQQSGPLSAL
ncbi:MAG: hypothetical protein ACRDY1_13165, partial [Acidimicrobiales bacterium]